MPLLAGQRVGGFRGFSGESVYSCARLGFAAGFEVGKFQLRDAVYQVGNLSAKLGGELVAGNAAVFDNIMQEAGGKSCIVHFKLGQDNRDGDRVRDIRLSRPAKLAFVLGFCVVVGPAQKGVVRARVVDAGSANNIFDWIFFRHRYSCAFSVLSQHFREKRCSPQFGSGVIACVLICLCFRFRPGLHCRAVKLSKGLYSLLCLILTTFVPPCSVSLLLFAFFHIVFPLLRAPLRP